MKDKNEGIVISGGGGIHAQQVVVGHGAQAHMTASLEASDKAELQRLLQQLTQHLSAGPAAASDEAKAVVQQAGQLVGMADKEGANPSLLKIIGNGVRQTAAFVKDTAPEAIETVERLLALVAKLHGIGI